MKVGDSAGNEGATTYAYRVSAFGAPRTFSLTGDGVDWAAGSSSGHIPLGNIRRIRMSYWPGNLQSHRFMTELWAVGAPKLKILSTSWKSMVEQERLDQLYSDFVAELHRRMALAAPGARFEQGQHPLRYWPGLIVFAVASLGMAALLVRALVADAEAGAAFVAAFLLLFLWRGGNFFRRNRPGFYRPESLPAELMPKP